MYHNLIDKNIYLVSNSKEYLIKELIKQKIIIKNPFVKEDISKKISENTIKNVTVLKPKQKINLPKIKKLEKEIPKKIFENEQIYVLIIDLLIRKTTKEIQR